VRVLLDHLREQAERLASLEDQRFQLGVQLGSAIERIAQLELQYEARPQRIRSSLIAAVAVKSNRPPIEGAYSADPQISLRFRDMALKITGAGQRSARIGSSLFRGRQRIADRSDSSVAGG
jgi:hypothetical protein